MVKSLTSILVALALLVGAGIFEWFYVTDQFEEFGNEVHSLMIKTENETANGEDARAVQASWEHRKENLHIWIPHNDIIRVDDYLSETVRLIAEKNYALALPKLEILSHLCETIPGTYEPGLENIF